jgi:hypothetical protein
MWAQNEGQIPRSEYFQTPKDRFYWETNSGQPYISYKNCKIRSNFWNV